MYEVFEQLCKKKGVTPYKVAKTIGTTTATFSNWKAGRYSPKADKLQKIADYFGVSVDYLMTGEEPAVYYESEEAAEIANRILNDPDLRALMQAADGSSPENLKLAQEMLMRFKGTNPNG